MHIVRLHECCSGWQLTNRIYRFVQEKYREYNERVQTVIPKERLLVYNVKQGWEPLCMFLGCEVPQESFPWVNRGQRGTLSKFVKVIGPRLQRNIDDIL